MDLQQQQQKPFLIRWSQLYWIDQHQRVFSLLISIVRLLNNVDLSWKKCIDATF